MVEWVAKIIRGLASANVLRPPNTHEYLIGPAVSIVGLAIGRTYYRPEDNTTRKVAYALGVGAAGDPGRVSEVDDPKLTPPPHRPSRISRGRPRPGDLTPWNDR